jgi:hypothetical protein
MGVIVYPIIAGTPDDSVKATRKSVMLVQQVLLYWLLILCLVARWGRMTR